MTPLMDQSDLWIPVPIPILKQNQNKTPTSNRLIVIAGWWCVSVGVGGWVCVCVIIYVECILGYSDMYIYIYIHTLAYLGS